MEKQNNPENTPNSTEVIMKLVWTIIITNGLWYLSNAKDIGNIDENETSSETIRDIFLIGDARIAFFIFTIPFSSHYLTSAIARANIISSILPTKTQGMPEDEIRRIKTAQEIIINNERLQDLSAAVILGLKYYFGAAGWTAGNLYAIKNIDRSNVKGKIIHSMITGLGSGFGIALLHNATLRRGPTDDTIIRLLIAAFFEGSIWTISSYGVGELSNVYLSSLILGISTYAAFCAGFVILPENNLIQSKLRGRKQMISTGSWPMWSEELLRKLYMATNTKEENKTSEISQTLLTY